MNRLSQMLVPEASFCLASKYSGSRNKSSPSSYMRRWRRSPDSSIPLLGSSSLARDSGFAKW